MMPQRALFSLALLALAGCGERAPSDLTAQGSTTPAYERAKNEPMFSEAEMPVRIGELGPGFAACSARGATRDRVATGPVPVRAAPFEQAKEIDGLPQGTRFFICSRTHDQRWFGIVYDESGQVAERCGVSDPVSSRRNYDGPCSAGWIPSSAVRLVSGDPNQLPKASPPGD